MANNRFNKPAVNKPIPDYTPRKKEKVEEVKLDLKPCCVCKKNISDGYYSHWADSGVCSRACDIIRNHEERKYDEAHPVTAFNGSIYRPR